MDTKSLNSVGDTYTDGEGSIVTIDEPERLLRKVVKISSLKIFSDYKIVNRL